jgi:hypothetical protein
VDSQYIPRMGDVSSRAFESVTKLALLSAAEVTEVAKQTARPSWAQSVAGNYRKGKFKWHGLEIALENARGSVRMGANRSWSFVMKDHYGYFVGSRSQADGDPIDVFVSTFDLKPELAYVINQNNRQGSFDEHKVVVGVANAAQAETVYRRNYPEDWTGFGGLVALTLPQLAWWLKNADTARALPADFWKEGILKCAEAHPLLCGCDGTIKQANDHFGRCGSCGKQYFDMADRLERSLQI